MSEGPDLVALELRLSELEALVARERDRHEIENLMARYQHFRCAGDVEQLRVLWSTRPDVSSELGASGVFEGREKVLSQYHEPRPGRLQLQVASMPDLLVDPTGSTASGVWVGTGVDTDAGELGPEPSRSSEDRQLLTSEDDGSAYRAEWVWERIHVDLVKEDGAWRLWRLRTLDLLRCPFDRSWVSFAEQRFETDGLRLDALYPPFLEPGPGGRPRENLATRASTDYWQYRLDALPPPYAVPRPPDPDPDTDEAAT